MADPHNQHPLRFVASTVVTALVNHVQVRRFSEICPSLHDAAAYQVTALIRAEFEARGERIIGRKIGFTNRDMWEVYGVQAPIWGYCTNRTTFELAETALQRVGDFVEPRIEPEIIFGLDKAPRAFMDVAALVDCIEWVSLGYEVVQSIYPEWKFTATDTIAANALHGALLIGRRHPVAPRKAAWLSELATFRADLFCDGKHCKSGGGALVLGSPLLALQHLVNVLADDAHNPPLVAGDIVSTGTLTLAMPVKAGQTWLTRVHGIPLEDITLRFEA